MTKWRKNTITWHETIKWREKWLNDKKHLKNEKNMIKWFLKNMINDKTPWLSDWKKHDWMLKNYD